jgi:hypothetical protein
VSARRRVAAVVGRAALRLVPKHRRDWVSALWAESADPPPGWERARWRAGAVRLVAEEALRPWTAPGRVAFLIAAVLAIVGCWPGSSSGVATAADRADVLAGVAVLAMAGWLGRRAFGPVRAGWLPRAVRAAGYGVILAELPAQAIAVRYCYSMVLSHPYLRRYHTAKLATGTGLGVIEAIFLIVLACCLLVVLWTTSERGLVTGRTVALAVGFGLAFGACGYLTAPLGPGSSTGPYAVSPWLPLSWISRLTVADWALLLAGPAVLAPIAGLCFAGRGDDRRLIERRLAQCVCVGQLSGVVAALTAALATGLTVAAALQSPRAASWLDHGAHFSRTAGYLFGLNVAGDESAYLVVCFCVPMVGALVGFFSGGLVLAGVQRWQAAGLRKQTRYI